MAKVYLVKENTAYIPSIELEGEPGVFIPLENLRILLGEGDPNQVLIPSIQEVIRVANELKDTVFNVRYDKLMSPGVTLFPTANDLNTEYDNAGIEVEESASQTPAILRRNPTNPPSERVAVEQDGILIILENGSFEVAGFQNDKWLIDQTKNALPIALDALDARITINEDEIADIITVLGTLNAINLTTFNDKDMIDDKGQIGSAATTTFPNRLATRERVREELFPLRTDVTGNTTAIATEKGRIDVIEPQITTINGEQTTQNTRLTALEATTIDKFVKGKWELKLANISPTGSPLPGDNIATFDIPLIDDEGTAITRTFGDIVLFAIEGDASGLGVFRETFTIEYGAANADIIEAVKEATGNNLELLLGQFDNDVLTITRNSGTDIDFSTLKIQLVEQELFVAKTNIALVGDLVPIENTANTALASTIVNATNIATNSSNLALKEDKDAVVSQGSYTGATLTSGVVPKINEHSTALKTIEDRAENNEADIDELNLTKFDVAGNGTLIKQVYKTDGEFTDEWKKEVRWKKELNADTWYEIINTQAFQKGNYTVYNDSDKLEIITETDGSGFVSSPEVGSSREKPIDSNDIIKVGSTNHQLYIKTSANGITYIEVLTTNKDFILTEVGGEPAGVLVQTPDRYGKTTLFNGFDQLVAFVDDGEHFSLAPFGPVLNDYIIQEDIDKRAISVSIGQATVNWFLPNETTTDHPINIDAAGLLTNMSGITIQIWRRKENNV